MQADLLNNHMKSIVSVDYFTMLECSLSDSFVFLAHTDGELFILGVTPDPISECTARSCPAKHNSTCLPRDRDSIFALTLS